MCLAIAIAPEQPTFGEAVVLFLREVLGGIALGACAAVLMNRMLQRSEDYGTQLLVSLAIISLAYGLAEHIEILKLAVAQIQYRRIPDGTFT